MIDSKDNPTIIEVQYSVDTKEGFDGRPCVLFLPEETKVTKIESLVKKDAELKYPNNRGCEVIHITTRKQYLTDL